MFIEFFINIFKTILLKIGLSQSQCCVRLCMLMHNFNYFTFLCRTQDCDD